MLKSKRRDCSICEPAHHQGLVGSSSRSSIAAAFSGMLVALFLSTPVYAFSPVQAPILIAPAISPNVLILLDNSLSMKNAIAPLAAS